MSAGDKIEFGDFQTPPELAAEISSLLARRDFVPDHVLEPTCGIGAFLVAAVTEFPNARLLGWDINSNYVEQTRQALAVAGASHRSEITTQDFFKHEWAVEFEKLRGNLLIIGNLPWVTSAVISSLNGNNLPEKRNFQGLRGLDARTGKSNFDVSEWMLIELLDALCNRSATIAILCKTAVARKALRFAWKRGGWVECASIYKLDAKKHFDVSVDACLLWMTTGSSGPRQAPVYETLQSVVPAQILGLVGKNLVSDIRAYERLRFLEGLSPYQWRSGIKHDCSSVMELSHEDGVLRNKLGEVVDVETDYLFPLLKCSDLANGRTKPERFVLVTQTRIGEDTSLIAQRAPKTWRYLESHLEKFQARKSSIYAKAVPFALFGVGDYSFSQWKVAVSGLHKTPRFNVVGSIDKKPIMLDDTCYFVPFQDEEEANVVADILNSEASMSFISSLLFEDSKRPVTVELLSRLNIHAIASEAGLLSRWSRFRDPSELHFASTKSAVLQGEFIMEKS